MLGTEQTKPGDFVLSDSTQATLSFHDEGDVLVLSASARYKPDDEWKHRHETDEYGYLETEPEPVLWFPDLEPLERELVREFVPLAVERGGGFAGFRKNATKTISLLDRLKAIQLPNLDDPTTRARFVHYLRQKRRADELEEKIEHTDQLIDEIVYELYGLTDEEIAVVESGLDRAHGGDD